MIEKLNHEVNAAFADPRMRARLADLGERRWLGHPPTLAAGETEK